MSSVEADHVSETSWSPALAVRFDGADGDPKFAYEKRNGFTIAWTAKGEIKPAAARGSM